jgi:hypothetical protein
MNKLRRICAAVVLSLTLTVSALAGIIHSPGAVDPPPPPPDETSTTTDIATTVILTIISLTPTP